MGVLITRALLFGTHTGARFFGNSHISSGPHDSVCSPFRVDGQKLPFQAASGGPTTQPLVSGREPSDLNQSLGKVHERSICQV